jgi:capsular polysaccharide transport system permease protein
VNAADLPPLGSFRRGLLVQRRVIGALMMREVISRFGRANLGVLWLLGEPMMFTMGVAALWFAADMNHGSSIPIVSFAITGYSSVLMWRNGVGRCSRALQENLNLLYHRHVQAIDVLLTRILLEICGATASFVVLSTLFIALESVAPPADMSLVLFGWLMLAWFAFALAINIGALTSWSHLVERFWHPTSYLLFPLSGAAFMVEWLPPLAREVVLLLPMVHGLEIMREGFFGPMVKTHYDMGYMATCCLVLTLTGLFLTREAARRVEAE